MSPSLPRFSYHDDRYLVVPWSTHTRVQLLKRDPNVAVVLGTLLLVVKPRRLDHIKLNLTNGLLLSDKPPPGPPPSIMPICKLLLYVQFKVNGGFNGDLLAFLRHR